MVVLQPDLVPANLGHLQCYVAFKEADRAWKDAQAVHATTLFAPVKEQLHAHTHAQERAARRRVVSQRPDEPERDKFAHAVLR